MSAAPLSAAAAEEAFAALRTGQHIVVHWQDDIGETHVWRGECVSAANGTGPCRIKYYSREQHDAAAKPIRVVATEPNSTFRYFGVSGLP